MLCMLNIAASRQQGSLYCVHHQQAAGWVGNNHSALGSDLSTSFCIWIILLRTSRGGCCFSSLAIIQPTSSTAHAVLIASEKLEYRSYLRCRLPIQENSHLSHWQIHPRYNCRELQKVIVANKREISEDLVEYCCTSSLRQFNRLLAINLNLASPKRLARRKGAPMTYSVCACTYASGGAGVGRGGGVGSRSFSDGYCATAVNCRASSRMKCCTHRSCLRSIRRQRCWWVSRTHLIVEHHSSSSLSHTI